MYLHYTYHYNFEKRSSKSINIHARGDETTNQFLVALEQFGVW